MNLIHKSLVLVDLIIFSFHLEFRWFGMASLNYKLDYIEKCFTFCLLVFGFFGFFS